MIEAVFVIHRQLELWGKNSETRKKKHKHFWSEMARLTGLGGTRSGRGSEKKT